MIKWFYEIFNLIYPVTCMGCDQILSSGETILCTVCRSQVPVAVDYVRKDNQVKELFFARVPIHAATSLFYYEKIGSVQNMIHQLKYNGQEQVGTMLGKWLGATMDKDPAFNDIDIVIPVPIHKKRLQERGYNQCTAFGIEVAGVLGVRFRESVLIKTTNTKKQAQKNQSQRSDETQSPFLLNETVPDGSHILLVDDVITTGTTVAMCVRELQKIPNVRISIASMALSV